MTVFKSYFKILKRMWTVFIPLAIFIFMSIVMNSNSKNMNKTIEEEFKNIEIGVLDQDQSEVSKDLVDYISTKAIIKDISLEGRAFKDALFYQEYSAALIIPKGFGEGYLDGSVKIQKYRSIDDYTSYYVDLLINNYLELKNSYEEKFGEHANEYLLEDIDVDTPVIIETPNEKITMLTAFRSYFRFEAYLLFFEVIAIVGLLASIFNNENTRHRINSSGHPGGAFQAKVLAAHFVVAIVFFVIPIIIGLFLYPVSIVFSKGGLLAIFRSFIHMLTVLSMAFLLTVSTTRQEIVMMIANFGGLVFSFIGGVFVPLEVMSEDILKISRFLPQYWFTTGIEEVLGPEITAANMQNFFKGIGIELIMAAAFLVIGFAVNRQKRMLRI